MLPVIRPLQTSAPDVNQADSHLPGDDAGGQAGQARPNRHQSNGIGMTWASVVRQAPLSAHPAAQDRPRTGRTRDASELSAKPEDARFKQQATNQVKQPVATADHSAVAAPIQSPASVIRASDRRRPPKSVPVSTINTPGANGPDRPDAVVEPLNARILKRYEKGQVGLDDVMKVTTSNIKKATLDNALLCVEAMKKAGIAPDVIIYSALISSCEREKRADKAFEVFDDMRARHVAPNVITYSALISACEKAGWADKALEVFSDMRDRRVVPDVITYNALISACEKAGRADKALEGLSDMRAQHIAPDVITYTALISACDKDDGRARQQIPQLLRAMVTEGLFHSSLGYAGVNNTLDFHENHILVRPEADAHIQAVNAAVAKAIFNHHVAEKHISGETKFIVGQHGEGVIKTTIAQCMRHHGLIPIDATMPSGIQNPGMLVSSAPTVART